MGRPTVSKPCKILPWVAPSDRQGSIGTYRISRSKVMMIKNFLVEKMEFPSEQGTLSVVLGLVRERESPD